MDYVVLLNEVFGDFVEDVEVVEADVRRKPAGRWGLIETDI